MTPKRVPISKELQAMKRRLKELETQLKNTRSDIKEERAKGPGYADELSQQLAGAELSLDIIKKKITNTKSYCKKRKREIDEWKLWYNGQPQSQRAAALIQLNQEIAWRAEEIALQESAINTLYLELLQVEGDVEKTRIKIKALRSGSLEIPLEDDPRISRLVDEMDNLKQQILSFKVTDQ